MDALAQLKSMAGSSVDVLVVDFDRLSCISAKLTNLNDWGCRLTSDNISVLHKNIGIRIGEANEFVKAQVTAVRKKDAAVVFPATNNKVTELRREKRSDVDIPVEISDKSGKLKVKGKIVNAAPNGCRVQAVGMEAFTDDDVILSLEKFEKPIIGEIAWRNKSGCGLRLIWNLKEFE